jgi:hypothetical protein
MTGKLKLSPTASALAAEILKLTQNMPQIVCTQDARASLTSIKSDTVYRALREIADIDLIEGASRRDGFHTIISVVCWTWLAIEQQGARS